MDTTHHEVIRAALTPLAPIPTNRVPMTALDGPVRAVLFDIYGTLLISGTGDIGVSALERDALGIGGLMADAGFPVVLQDAESGVPHLLDHFIREEHRRRTAEGVDYPEVEIREIWGRVLKRLWDDGMLESDPAGTATDTLALRHEMAVNPVWPMPGFPELVEELRRAGLRLGIVSNAQFYTPLILEALTGRSLEDMGFEDSLCAWSYTIRRAKPSPGIFSGPLTRLEKDGIPASEVLYVGNDMLNDVSAASRAGCRTALFAGDRRSLRLREGDARADAEPDIIITELAQLTGAVLQGAADGQA